MSLPDLPYPRHARYILSNLGVRVYVSVCVYVVTYVCYPPVFVCRWIFCVYRYAVVVGRDGSDKRCNTSIVSFVSTVLSMNTLICVPSMGDMQFYAYPVSNLNAIYLETNTLFTLCLCIFSFRFILLF